MGTEQTLYLGCYVEWNTVFEEGTSITFICGKCQATYSRKQNFCSNCGGEVLEKKDPYVYPKDMYDLLEDTEYFEELIGNEEIETTKGRSIGIPNGGDHNFIKDPQQEDTVEVTPELISQATLHFKEEFVNVLAFLETKVKNLEVKFGIVNYWI